ncbi:MAG TPA: PaaI family thioesterase [Thermodesulfobacteriota bacterium]|nr:PaaI family thioesterase [Thermodesulfobacteriota bacterium]
MSEPRLNPRYTKAISNIVNRSPYFSLLSMKIKELDWGTSVLEVELEEKHLQPFGYVHGGAIASVMDAATFWAVFPQVRDGMGLTTVEIKVNFLAPVREGRLVVKGRCIKIGKTLALGDATIYDAKGNLLAHGTATMMIVPDLKVEGQDKLPPKHI